MNEPSSSNHELIEELSVLKKRIRELEHSKSDRSQAEQELTLLIDIGFLIRNPCSAVRNHQIPIIAMAANDQ
jgi:Tfp pilus assembly protein PilN